MTMKAMTTDPAMGRISARAPGGEPAALEQLLVQLAKQAAAPSIANDADRYPEFLDEVVRASLLLARWRAATLAEVVAKIRVWRTLACEDALDEARASPEELLLLSIIDDVEALAR